MGTTFLVHKYKVAVMAGSPDMPAYVLMYDNLNKYFGQIHFKENYSGLDIIETHGVIYAYMPLKKLSYILDILRNEKPVFFVVNEKNGKFTDAYLRTGEEPVGEEEGI